MPWGRVSGHMYILVVVGLFCVRYNGVFYAHMAANIGPGK